MIQFCVAALYVTGPSLVGEILGGGGLYGAQSQSLKLERGFLMGLLNLSVSFCKWTSVSFWKELEAREE